MWKRVGPGMFRALLMASIAVACGGETDGAAGGQSTTLGPSPTTASTTPPTTSSTSTTSTTVRPTTTTTVPPAKVDFADAVFRGILDVEATGNGLTSVKLTVTSSAAENLLVTIAPATLFASQSQGIQSMVATTSQDFRIQPGGRVTQTVSAACANMNLGTPSPADTFAVSGHHSAEMAALMGVAGFSGAPFRVKQFAVWTISDNPFRGGYTGLSGSDGSGQPSAEEIDRIRELFAAAGLNPSDWRALR